MITIIRTDERYIVYMRLDDGIYECVFSRARD